MHWKWFFELLQMGTKYLKTGATDDTTDSYAPKDNAKKPAKQQQQKPTATATATATTNGNKKKKNAKAAKKNN